MLDGDLVAVEHLKRAAQGLGGGNIALTHGENAEVAPAGDAGDEALVRVLGFRHLIDYHGAGVFRAVRIADIEGYSLLPHGEDGLLMQYGGAHERHLAKLAVGDGGDGLGVLYDLGVSHEYA